MLSSIDFLDYDVSNLLGEYIKTKKKNKFVLNELKDNILFSTHMNYYKIFKSSKDHNGRESNLYRNMLKNRHQTLATIKKIEFHNGWIVDYPTKFSWDCDRFVNSRLNTYVFKGRTFNNNLTLVDKSTNWEYKSYPPHPKHFNSKSLLKIMKRFLKNEFTS